MPKKPAALTSKKNPAKKRRKRKARTEKPRAPRSITVPVTGAARPTSVKDLIRASIDLATVDSTFADQFAELVAAEHEKAARGGRAEEDPERNTLIRQDAARGLTPGQISKLRRIPYEAVRGVLNRSKKRK